MNSAITIFASEQAAAAEQADLFSALGIDVRLLVVQLVSFLILFLILRKFVFPVLQSALDQREKTIKASVAAAKDAQAAAEKAEEATEAQLKKAKDEAAEILAVAHKEAAKMVEDAEAKAEKRAEHLVAQAKSRLETDVADARKMLRAEMTGLVAEATEKIVRQKMDAKADAKLIESALKEAK